MIRHRFAPRLLAMDAADPALPLEPCLVGLAAIGGVGPDVGGGIVAGDDIAQHPPVEARTIGDLAFADEAEGPADRHAAFVAESGDGNVDARLAVCQGFCLGKLHRSASIRVLLCRPGGFVRPYLAGRPACLDSVLLRRGRYCAAWAQPSGTCLPT